MGTPMSDRQRQQRAAMIVGGAAVGGLAIIGLAIALSSGGGDDTNAIDVRRSTTTSSSTTSSSTSTSTSTSTTTTLITLPATVPPTAPPTIITVPTLAPTSPTTAAPTTSPPTTKPPSTTSTTKPPTPAQQLALTLDTALNGGQPDPPPRVTVKPIGNNKTLDVTWALDASLSPDEQGTQAREDTLVLFQTIQASDPPSNDHMRLRATIPKPGPDRVILLVIDRSQFDAFDFSSFDPDTTDVFTLPFITSKDINTTYVPDPYPPSSTTTTDGSTTTTEETTTTTS